MRTYSAPSTVVNPLHTFAHLIFWQPCEISTILIMPFCRWGNWGREISAHQIGSRGRCGIQTRWRLTWKTRHKILCRLKIQMPVELGRKNKWVKHACSHTEWWGPWPNRSVLPRQWSSYFNPSSLLLSWNSAQCSQFFSPPRSSWISIFLCETSWCLNSGNMLKF